MRAIKDYVSGEKGVTQICAEMTINIATFYEWLRKYNASGELSLIVSKNIKYYPDSVKLNAVNDYLDGKGSLRAICSIYEISNHRVLRNWIKAYNSHKTFKSRNNQ